MFHEARKILRNDEWTHVYIKTHVDIVPCLVFMAPHSVWYWGLPTPTPPPHAKGGRDTYYIILHNVYVCTYTTYVYTHVSIYIYMYVCVYIYIYDAALPGPPLPPNGYGYTGAMFAAPPVSGAGVVVVVVVAAVSRSE